MLIPVGEAGIFEKTLISLNDTCRFLWNLVLTPRSAGELISQGQEDNADTAGEREQGSYRVKEA